MMKNLRRIVTGHNQEGKSVIKMIGRPPIVNEDGEAGLAEMWVTDSMPADNTSETEATDRVQRLEPPPNGTLIRLFTIPPRDPNVSREELDREVLASFRAWSSEHCLVDTSRDAMMHKTKTVDYIIVLSGSLTLVLEDEEVDIKPFDVIVQRGTNHSWVNRGTETALLAAVLIDAVPLPQ